MKKSIVLKWFVLTALLFSVMFLVIGIMQDYFFERYYINKKLDTLTMHMDEYQNQVTNKGTEKISEELYESEHIWITKLDQYGIISDVANYYIEVSLQDEFHSTMRIPMYSFEGNYSDMLFFQTVGEQVIIDTVNLAGEKIPYLIQTDSRGVANLTIANKLHGTQADPNYSHLITDVFRGTITEVVFPERIDQIPFPYQEHFFLEQIKEFQVKLLGNYPEPLLNTGELGTTENFVDYKIIIKPVIEDGEIKYIFAMTSLQPVDEAISVMREFYPYVFVITIICIIFLAFIFSKWLAKPLISINQTTEKIANLDFTETLPVRSDDEIGQLSENINYLSNQMETYIFRLKLDLEKEQKLESTRKEFIAGVSHELKTPLAVMKSCLSILKDGIAVEKREHYFQAMEAEIEQMDQLIVNMLDLAKFESGTYKPEMAPFEIDKVITEVSRSLAEQIRKKSLNLMLNLDPLIVVGHKGLISRVITNFLINAIQHTDEGHLIEITVQNDVTTAEVRIENQGKPISEENMEKLWNQFYRAEARASKVGTGLGLSISKEILELHHARYGVVNTNNGVRFFFSLPIK